MKNINNAKILLVEDNKVQAGVILEYLQGIGHDVTWVMDGKSAIKAAIAEEIDIVLLDLELPDMHGTQISRFLKQNEDTRGVPIIMLTATDSLSGKVLGLESGADDYLLKPYKEVELNARIYACLRTKSLQDELLDKNKQLKELLEKVEKLAITDPLTNMYNRRYYESVLHKEFKRMQRYGFPLSCAMLDLDHFKQVNDQFGHKAGDTVLKDTADILHSCVRDVDTVARWGGEEFIVLFPQTDRGAAHQVAERIRQTVESNDFDELGDHQVTVSIGIATAPGKTIESSEKLVNLADDALYQAKEQGRNRVVML